MYGTTAQQFWRPMTASNMCYLKERLLRLE